MKLFSSDAVYIQNLEAEAIDAENGIIKGVKVCSEGEAKGHGLYLNKQFIRDVTEHGKAHKVGIKARFGHPNMCATALGTYVGRYKNFRTTTEPAEGFTEGFDEFGKPRLSGNRMHAVADLHLDETAKSLPKLGNTWDYILNLAQTSPDMFGNSIVFKGVADVKKWEEEEGGVKVKKQRNDAVLKFLAATDLVDSPAATDGLFSEFSTDEMAIQVTQFLEEHPEIYELAVDNPEIIDTFLKKYESFKNHKEMTDKKKDELADKPVTKTVLQTMFDSLKERFNKRFGIKGEDDEIVLPEEHQKELDEIQEQITAFKDPEDEELKKENEELKEELSAIKTLLAKANGQSTKPDGLKGAEDDDEEGKLSDDEKQLKADAKNLSDYATKIID